MTDLRPTRQHANTLSLSQLHHTVCVEGWVHSRRDHGGVIFVDLRDRSGRVQVVFQPGFEQFQSAEKLRDEYVIRVIAVVAARPEGSVNPNLASGTIELIAQSLTVLNTAQTLPFQIEDNNTSEALRLQYRYLDLRRQSMQKNLMLRHQVTHTIRNFLDQAGFIDVETPILTKSTPEGARDYLVPSRVHHGQFFALPQSPQLFKQLLMVSGFERYYQIARCFRDEDLRADRQPEFTQVDIETSFLDEYQIMELVENLIRQVFSDVMAVDLIHPFPRMSYHEAMSRYGSDKPDLRNPLQLVDISAAAATSGFEVFAAAAARKGSRVVVLRAPNGASLSRSQIDNYGKLVAIYGAKGLAWIKVNQNTPEGLASPILKFLSPSFIQHLLEVSGAQAGDLLFFGADSAKVVNAAMGALRDRLGQDLNLLSGDWAPLWVVDFPMFEWIEEEQRMQAMHHPFTSPKPGHETLALEAPEQALARAYDLVLNGSEIGGGSIRIHDGQVQQQVFQALGLKAEEIELKFGFLLKALSYGAPPHGGLALGLDRIVSMLCGADSIREVIAFPKTQRAQCLMTQAPSEVDQRQWRELGLMKR